MSDTPIFDQSLIDAERLLTGGLDKMATPFYEMQRSILLSRKTDIARVLAEARIHQSRAKSANVELVGALLKIRADIEASLKATGVEC